MTPYRPRVEALELLGVLGHEDIPRRIHHRSTRVEQIRYAMVTEYDACLFSEFLASCNCEGMYLSDEFLEFHEWWRVDEWNHYIGYRRILHLISGLSENELHRMALQRTADYAPIAHLLHDEFHVCVAFAYDEIVTWHACRLAEPLFSSLGHDHFTTWIKLVGHDEARHFGGIVKVVHACHESRLKDCAPILDQLVSWDMQGNPYNATFILDHDVRLLGADLLHRCAQIVMRAFCGKGYVDRDLSRRR